MYVESRLIGRPGESVIGPPVNFFSSALHPFAISFVSSDDRQRRFVHYKTTKERKRFNMNKDINVLKPHISLNVRDISKSIDFYRKLLGIEPSKVRTGYAKFDVKSPQLNLALNEIPFNERGALSHLGIQVASTDDVLAVRMRWADE